MFDAAHANAVLDASMDQANASVRLATQPIHVRLMTAVGSATVNGTELATSGNYTSGVGAPTVTFSVAAGQSKASNSAVTVTSMPATSLNGVELWDSAGTPARKQLGGITGAPKTTNAGDTFTIASTALTEGLT